MERQKIKFSAYPKMHRNYYVHFKDLTVPIPLWLDEVFFTQHLDSTEYLNHFNSFKVGRQMGCFDPYGEDLRSSKILRSLITTAHTVHSRCVSIFYLDKI